MHKLLLLSFLALMGLQIGPMGIEIGPKSACAQDVAEQPCDPAFYNQMRSRAWLEAEREIMQNQNLIFKADSVLDYVCMENWAGVAAWEGGDIFTHTDYFGGQIIPRGGADALEVVMETIIGDSLDGWMGNFDHFLLGGRGEFYSQATLEKSLRAPVSNGATRTYACGRMSRVWNAAKCLNFVHNAEFNTTDAFYPFEEIAALNNGPSIDGYDTINDTRRYPSNMVCNNESDLTTWETEIADAENEYDLLYDFATPLGQVFEVVAERIVPAICTGGIATGVTVVLSSGPEHLDGVCTNPGCTYRAGSLTQAGDCSL